GTARMGRGRLRCVQPVAIMPVSTSNFVLIGCAAAIFVVCVRWGFLVRRMRRRRRIVHGGLCGACEYPRPAGAERCPECGEEYKAIRRRPSVFLVLECVVAVALVGVAARTLIGGTPFVERCHERWLLWSDEFVTAEEWRRAHDLTVKPGLTSWELDRVVARMSRVVKGEQLGFQCGIRVLMNAATVYRDSTALDELCGVWTHQGIWRTHLRRELSRTDVPLQAKFGVVSRLWSIDQQDDEGMSWMMESFANSIEELFTVSEFLIESNPRQPLADKAMLRLLNDGVKARKIDEKYMERLRSIQSRLQ
ncbi:MAG: hypothetical protein AABZ53_08305, partial [Planctomycetota bacterium]